MRSAFRGFVVRSLAIMIAISVAFMGFESKSQAQAFQDVSYAFGNGAKQSADAFQFLRSYVDYFYLVTKANKSNLRTFDQLSSFSGLCVGDAHPENFGFLILQDGSSMFTMNDIDDSGPCPVAYDLYRLLVSSRLYDPSIDLDLLLQSYLDGLASDRNQMKHNGTSKAEKLSGREADVAEQMYQESQRKGARPSSKKVVANKLVRDSLMREVSQQEQAEIESSLKQMHLGLTADFAVLDLVATSKASGGSAGLSRYEVLVQSGGDLIHLELKEQIEPGIYPVATGPLPSIKDKIQNAVELEQNGKASSLYSYTTIGSKVMFCRPRFAGNVGVKLSENSVAENANLIRYEAFTLGQIHKASLGDASAYANLLRAQAAQNIQADVDSMAELFRQKFSSL